MYAIFFTNQAKRLFKKLPQDIQDKLKLESSILTQYPQSGEPLRSRFSSYRTLHVSFKGIAYRIIYQAIPKTSTIAIVLADKRENLYKRLQEMKL